MEDTPSTASIPSENSWETNGGVRLAPAPPTVVKQAEELQSLELEPTAIQEKSSDEYIKEQLAKELEEQEKSELENVLLPEGNGEQFIGYSTEGNLSDIISRGTQVPVQELAEGELFKLPAVMIDLRNCEIVYQICLAGLGTFLYNSSKTNAQEIPQNKKCYVYLRNNEQIYLLSYGHYDTLINELPDYINRAFGEEATVKEVVQKPDGAGYKLKKCTSSVKSVHLNLDYWF